MTQDLNTKAIALVATSGFGLWGVGIALGIVGVVSLAPDASACEINVLAPCSGGTCFVNAGVGAAHCNGGDCTVNVGICGAGTCSVNVAAQCWGGSCFVNVQGSCSTGCSSPVNVGTNC